MYLLLIAMAILAGAGVARAQGIDADPVTIRGFGTASFTTHDADQIVFRRNVGQPQGVASGEIEGRTDSLAGLQANLGLGERLNFTLQGVTRLDVDGDWSPRLTQAFLRYSADESLVLRAGRFGYDIYLLAESRQVGYSYLTIRPSQDFYGLVTNDEIDGLDATWTTYLGRGLFKARVFGGRSSDQTAFADGSLWEAASDAHGLTIDYSFRSLTARAAWLQVSYGGNPELQQLGAFLASTGTPESVRIGGQLMNSSQTSRALQLGMAYDDGPLQAQLLYGQILSDSLAGPNVRAALAQVGYRIGSFTPFASFATSRDRNDLRFTGLPETPELLPFIEAIRALQDNVRATQRTTSLGVRWDLAPHWDLKVQADFASIADSALNFDLRPPGSGAVDMTVLGVAVDFVF